MVVRVTPLHVCVVRMWDAARRRLQVLERVLPWRVEVQVDVRSVVPTLV